MRRKLSRADAAYIAGFIDGDGYLGLINNRHRYPTPLVKISNTNKKIVLWLKERLGGSITPSKRKHSSAICYQLTLSANYVRWMLPQIIDFLKIKAEEAEIMLVALKLNEKMDIPHRARYTKLVILQEKLKRLHTGHSK